MQYLGNSYQQPYVTGGMPPFTKNDFLRSYNQVAQFTPSHPLLSYKCNFLEQLQGIFEMETAEGVDRIEVFKPMHKGYPHLSMIARRTCSDGVALPDQIIIEEPNRYILCSSYQEVVAWMPKGMDFSSGLTWKSANSYHEFIWKRIGQVPLNFVPGNSLCPSQLQSPRPPWNLVPRQHPEQYSSSSTDVGHDENENKTEDSYHNSMEEQYLLDAIKTFCWRRPNLLKKVIQWGLSTEMMTAAPLPNNVKMIERLAKGRKWVSCSLRSDATGTKSKRSPAQDELDNLKGAYQEQSQGVYVQPRPKTNEPGRQHRLRKVRNLWIIEEYKPVADAWNLRVQQESRRRWLDLRGSKPIHVKVTSLAKILERMGGETFEEDIEKQIEFLFQTCNQKKLNTKLKKRNIKHNIMNIKMQLKKQNYLSFAVRVVNKADEIAKECGIYS